MEAAAQGFLAWLFYCFRPVIKGFLRVTTRLCELQRVCYGERAGAPRTMAVGELHILKGSKDSSQITDEMVLPWGFGCN